MAVFKEYVCVNCSAFVRRANTKGLFCSLKCQMAYQTQERVNSWLRGEISGNTGKTKQTSPFVRKYLKDTRGSACSECGWDEYHPVDGSSLTELDHIDGNADNTTPDNLKILCPNCHSKTPTFRARNKKSSRKR